MFQVARKGLGTNLGLFLLRISSPQSHSLAAASPLSTEGSAAQKRLERATSDRPGKVPRLGSEAEEPSLKANEEAKLKASLGRCFSLLEAIGRESPRWDRTFTRSTSTSSTTSTSPLTGASSPGHLGCSHATPQAGPPVLRSTLRSRATSSSSRRSDEARKVGRSGELRLRAKSCQAGQGSCGSGPNPAKSAGEAMPR